MNENEMREEIERLRRELDAANKSRERLREMVFAFFPIDPPEVMEKRVEEMMQQPMKGIDDIITELMADERDSTQNGQSIPA